MTEKQDMGVVTQSDRKAAVDIYNVILHDWHTQHMLDGMEDECYVIQAFKKHRLASQAEQRACPVQFATVRDGGDEWHIECRFKDGQKFAAVTVDKDQEALADWIAKALATPARTDDAGVGDRVIATKADEALRTEPSGIDIETSAWAWLEKKFGTESDNPVDRAYDASEMVDAFHAGFAYRRAALSPAPDRVEGEGYIVGNASGDKWRTWDVLGPVWTAHRDQATRYARRIDAENVHREDEDAWRIEPFAATHPQPSQKMEGDEHY